MISEIKLSPEGTYIVSGKKQPKERRNEDGLLNLDLGGKRTLFLRYMNTEPTSSCHPELPGKMIMELRSDGTGEDIGWTTQCRNYMDANNKIVQFLAMLPQTILK